MVVGFSLECGGLMVDDEVKNVQDDHHKGQRGCGRGKGWAGQG